MKLELLHHPAQGKVRPVKLLFIHGICTGAWVWERAFLPFFAESGYESFALSLRGHGQSEGADRVRSFTLGDFAADVAWAVNETGAPAVVVGHSLGGAVVQNYVKRGGNPAGVVLLCSVPPHGLLRTSTLVFARNPLLWNELRKALEGGLRAADLQVIEDGLFSGPPPSELRRLLNERIGEVAAAASREVAGWIPFAPWPWAMPRLLVIGGGKDEFMPASDVRLTAIYYGERSVIVPDCVHAMMLDRSWLDPARTIAAWLEERFGRG